MPFLVCNGKILFFAHVPKTGGSSVEDYLIRRFGPLAMHHLPESRPTRSREILVPPQHLSASSIAALLPVGVDYSFALVRDPVSRILSEYRFQRGHSRVSRLSFSTWLAIVLAVARSEPRVYENHIRPQHEFIPRGAEVYRLEDGFAAMISRLDEVTESTASEIEVQHLLKRKSNPVTMSREDLALITDFYAEDYRRFGYPLPNFEDYPKDSIHSLRLGVGVVLSPMIVVRNRWVWSR